MILGKTIEPGDTAEEFPPNDIQEATFNSMNDIWDADDMQSSFIFLPCPCQSISIFILGDVVHLLSSHDADYTPKIYWRGIVKNARSSWHLIDEDYAGGREDRMTGPSLISTVQQFHNHPGQKQ